MERAPTSWLIHSAQELGRALRDRRRERGLSQSELAARSGVAQPTISNVERGSSRGSLDTVMRLAAELGLELVLRERPEIDLSDLWEGRSDG